MRFLTPALVVLWCWTDLPAQEIPPPLPPAPLFRSHDALELTLTADLKEAFSNRDTSKVEWVPATLAWKTEAGESRLSVEVSTRGHFRRKSSTCSVPPLRVRFPKDSVGGTVWDDQGSLKLVTHCRDKYDNLVLQEYLAYRIYNLFTPISFSVRLARIAWADTRKPGDTETHWGFFLEDDGDVAKRNHGKLFKDPGIGFQMGDPTHTGIMSVFFYMIANTDWSMPFQHNVKIVERGYQFFPLPYDFDWSGIVDAPYAKPDYRLPIRSVRQRLYRGPCYAVEDLAPILARFQLQREAITGLYQNLEGLEPKKRDDALKYLEEFWKVIDNPRSVDRELRGGCQR